jgi:hypothetical protein
MRKAYGVPAEAVNWCSITERVAKCYIIHYISSSGKSARQTYNANAYSKNCYFLEPQCLELLLEVNMALHPKSGSRALQTVFTAPKFRASVGDALRASPVGAPQAFRRFIFPAASLGEKSN